MTPRRQVTRVRVVHRAPAIGGELVELRVLAREAGLRTASASRFLALGLLERRGGTEEAPLFGREGASCLAAAERLRRELGLNHAGAVLAYELLARIEDLEARLSSAPA
jgi:hypothetical protein